MHSYTSGVVQARRGPGLELSGAPRAMGRGCAGGDSTTAEAKLKKSKLTAEVILSYLDATFFPCHLLENAKFLETYLSQ